MCSAALAMVGCAVSRGLVMESWWGIQTMDAGVDGPVRPAEAISAMRRAPSEAEGKTGPLGAIQRPCLSGGAERVRVLQPVGRARLVDCACPLDGGLAQLRRGA